MYRRVSDDLEDQLVEMSTRKNAALNPNECLEFAPDFHLDGPNIYAPCAPSCRDIDKRKIIVLPVFSLYRCNTPGMRTLRPKVYHRLKFLEHIVASLSLLPKSGLTCAIFLYLHHSLFTGESFASPRNCNCFEDFLVGVAARDTRRTRM